MLACVIVKQEKLASESIDDTGRSAEKNAAACGPQPFDLAGTGFLAPNTYDGFQPPALKFVRCGVQEELASGEVRPLVRRYEKHFPLQDVFSLRMSSFANLVQYTKHVMMMRLQAVCTG
jgi:hypothetical protein